MLIFVKGNNEACWPLASVVLRSLLLQRNISLHTHPSADFRKNASALLVLQKKCLLYHLQGKDKACRLLTLQPVPHYFFISIPKEQMMSGLLRKAAPAFSEEVAGFASTLPQNPGIITASAKNPAPQHSYWKNSWSFQAEWSGGQAPVLSKPHIFISSDNLVPQDCIRISQALWY